MERAEGRTCSAPWPLTATNRHPRSPTGSCSDAGRFGQPITLTLTSLSSMSARQTVYCSPRRKPLVPSIGSRVHIPTVCSVTQSTHAADIMMHLRPLGPPGWLPRSMAMRSESVDRRGAEGPIPHAGSSPTLRGTRSASFTREVRRSRSAFVADESPRRSAESSSPWD